MGRVGLLDNKYIVLKDEFWDERWINNSKTTIVFIYLLMNANTNAEKYGKDRIRRGSLVTTNEKIVEKCGLTYQNVRSALASLEKMGEIKRERRNHYQIITITHYEDYKDDI